MRNYVRPLLALSLTCGLALPALADDPRPALKAPRDTTKATTTNPDDVKTMTRIAQASMKEIQASKLATSATRKETRDFAQLLIDEHGKCAAELAALAKPKNITLPTTLEPSARKEIDSLASDKGIELDRHFITMMIDDHEDAIELFEAAAKDAKDAELQAFVGKNLPILRSHHRMAMSLKTKLDALSRR